MIDELLKKIDDSDKAETATLIENEITRKGQAWKIHSALFPVVQRVLNPPFINPHLPKMYRICREFLPYLKEDDIPALVRLEINEYTQRPKLKEIQKRPGQESSVSFAKIKDAIREGDREKVAVLLNAFLENKGAAALAHDLLLLGSGYLSQTLGHSVSCTAFILLEMMERSDHDPWPALAALADYFCKGQFHTMLALRSAPELNSEEVLAQHLLRATSGNGIVNLHHTITRYSIERARHLLSEAEYTHMLSCWVEFMGDKEAASPSPISPVKPLSDYAGFYQVFSKRNGEAVLPCLTGMISSKAGRKRLGRYLIKGICDQYQGSYDPHFINGLGSTLWVVEKYHEQVPLAMNALRQYLDYFFA